MPKLAPNVLPSYRLHRQSGQAVVTLNGKDILLGKHGTASSQAEYTRVTSEWLARGRQLPQDDKPLQIVELLARFFEHAQGYYRKDGRPTSEVENFRQAMVPLRRLYGKTSAVAFGPLALKTVRENMIGELGWCRTNTNKQISRLRNIFRWAAEQEIIPTSVWQSLTAVAGLKKGRTSAAESTPVRPVLDAAVDATLKHVSKQIRCMIELQRLTGMRPGEVCSMRVCDIDRRSADEWIYSPAGHKTEHHGHHRVVPLGPKARELLTLILERKAAADFVFDPRDAEAGRRERARAERKTPLSCGNREGTNRKAKPERAIGDRYTVNSYRKAITRGCDKAFPPPGDLGIRRRPGAKPAAKDKPPAERWETPTEWKARLGKRWSELLAWQASHRWHPHQLRHTAATAIRKQFGIEAAQVVLGHRTLKVTEIYAEKNVAEARRVMNLVG